MYRTRAFRLHHKERIKVKVRKYDIYGGRYMIVEGLDNVLAGHRPLCSSPWCCGNRRKSEGLTLQERSFNASHSH